MLCLLVISLLGIWPALYNGFPLVNSDSGANIMLSFVGYVPKDRSVFYTYFVRITNLGISLYGTVYAQSLIGTLLVYWWLRCYQSVSKALLVTLCTIVALAFCTPYAWYVSQINPDIFMGYYFVALLLLLKNNSRKWVKWALMLILMTAISFHNSILLISLLLGLACGLWALVRNTKKNWHTTKLILGMTFMVFIPTCLANYIAFRSFTPNPSSHIFIMSRLAEMGILEDVLKDECPTNSYQLCNTFKDFKGRQWDFMWVDYYPHGTEKWLDDSVKKEYNELVWKALTNPEHLMVYAQTNVKNAVELLPETKMDDGLHQFLEGSSPWNNINGFMPYQISAFSKAKQQGQTLNFDTHNHWIKYSFYTITLLLLVYLCIRMPQWKWRNIHWVALALCFCLINNALTCALSTNLERFSARLIWILPLMLFFQIIANQHQRKAH